MVVVGSRCQVRCRLDGWYTLADGMPIAPSLPIGGILEAQLAERDAAAPAKAEPRKARRLRRVMVANLDGKQIGGGGGYDANIENPICTGKRISLKKLRIFSECLSTSSGSD